MSCDLTSGSRLGVGLFLVVALFVSSLTWAYNHLVVPVWSYLDPSNPPGTSSMVWAGIGSVTVLIVQGAVTIANRLFKYWEDQAEAERQLKKEQAAADRASKLDDFVRQMDDMKRDMERGTKEAARKAEEAKAAAEESHKRDLEQDAERDQLRHEKEALWAELAELRAKGRIVEAKGEDTGAKVAVLQHQALKQNIIPKADPTRAPDAPRHTLVIAEDDPEWVGKLSGDFFALGFDVKTGVTLEKALVLVDKGAHFAIVDLRLGTEDGTQIIKAIREKGLHTEIVVFTAADDERLDRARELVGADRVIQKGPTDAGDKLIALIKRIMEERRRQAGI